MHGWDLSSRAVPLSEVYRARQLQSLSYALSASAPARPNATGPRSSHPSSESIAMMNKLDGRLLYSLQEVLYGKTTLTRTLPQMTAGKSSIEVKEAIASLSPRPLQPRTKEDTLIDSAAADSQTDILKRILFDFTKATAHTVSRKRSGVIVAGPAARLAGPR